MTYETEKAACERGASDFRADYEITDNPYNVNQVEYYLWKAGFSKAQDEAKDT